MRHVMAVAVLLGLLLAAAPGGTQAETWGWSEPEVHFRNLDLIAAGTITATNVNGNAEHIRFLPSDIWKGTPPEGEIDVYLATGGSSLKVGDKRVLSLYASHAGAYNFSHYDQGPYSNTKYFPHYFAVVQKYQPRWRVRLEEVIEAPDDAGALLRLARFLRDEGDRPGARSAFEKMIAHEPENALGHFELGQLLFKWGAYEPALTSLRRALLLAPDDQTVRRTIQHVQLNLGEKLEYRAVDFRGLRIGALDLSGQDLRGKDFRGITIESLHFEGANLDRANFDGVDLSNTNFTGASLRNTSLVGANLASTNFTDTDLTGAVVQGADFSGAWFVDATLNDLAAQGAKFDKANFQGASLSGADFTDASLQHAFVLGSQFDRTILEGIKLKGARYDCATVLPKRVSLSRHRMIPHQRVCDGVSQSVRFADADWSGVDFSGLDLRRADFTNANLKGARFDRADLRGAYFAGAKHLVCEVSRRKSRGRKFFQDRRRRRIRRSESQRNKLLRRARCSHKYVSLQTMSSVLPTYQAQGSTRQRSCFQALDSRRPNCLTSFTPISQAPRSTVAAAT